ncbi:MAG: hypothetical protein IH586_19795, partial [Anaerolineaceae bacterium]|nr:hypothetical protein [Anaerolineaceae bacterium]
MILVLFFAGQACQLTSAVISSNGNNGGGDEPAAMGEESPTGVISLPISVTAPDGVRVVEQAALWAPKKDAPELHTVSAAIVLESATAVLGFNMDYQIWHTKDKDKASEYKTNQRLWMTISPLQAGARMILMGDFPEWMKPTRIEIQLLPGDFYQERQKDLDLLNNLAFPKPYFSATSTGVLAKQQPAGNGLNIEANAKVTSSLPVEAGVSGLFIFYDSAGQVVGITTTLCSDSKSYGCGGTLNVMIPPNGTGDLTAQLPFPLDAQPAKVVLYPMIDTNFAQY